MTTVWTPKIFVDDWRDLPLGSPHREKLRKLYRDADKHYGFKVKADGGWWFFEFVEDMLVWKKQK